MAEILKGPNESQLAAIRKQLGEDQDRVEHNLELFKEWVDCQPHLPKNYGKFSSKELFSVVFCFSTTLE